MNDVPDSEVGFYFYRVVWVNSHCSVLMDLDWPVLGNWPDSGPSVHAAITARTVA